MTTNNEKQIIQLTLSKDYVSDWGNWEAIREILQNAIDSKEHKIEFNEDSMTITSFDGVIDKKHLILGNSSKRDDDTKIGTYGEGFKLALLVLIRENKNVVIHNGADVWTPFFDTHIEIENECLNVEIEKNVLTDNDGKVSFIISGLNEEEIKEIKEKSLFEANNFIEAEFEGSSCWESKGKPKLYIGGLYVCDLGKKYHMSYNFAPNILRLDRDRKSVCTFNLSYEATRMITLSGNYELLSMLADCSADDISDYYSFSEPTYYYGTRDPEVLTPSEKLKTIVSENFVSKHGELAYPISNDWDEKTKRIKTVKSIEAGYVPVIIKSGYYNMLTKALTEKKFEDFKFNLSEEIIAYFEENKKHLRSKQKQSLEKIVNMIYVMEGKEIPKEMKKKVVVDNFDSDKNEYEEPINVNDLFNDDVPF